MLNMDEFNFVSYKKKAQFKLNSHILPYIMNPKATTKEVDSIFFQMKLKLSLYWSYDPLRIISRLRLEWKSTYCAHTPRPEIEQYAN